jgi:hypothetical protein
MAIVRNKNTNVLYEYLGEDKYKNLITLQEGIVEERKAASVFNINLDATKLLGEYPEIKNLINKLKLKIENND